MRYLMVYLSIINALSLALMLVDKEKARRKRWRIPERRLLAVAALGGSAGCLLGMYLFRHKTRHPRFFIGVPVMLAVQIVLVLLLLRCQ